MSQAPETYRTFVNRYPQLAAAYEQLSDLSLGAGPLSPREQRLVKMAVSLGSRSSGATRSAIRKAFDAGLSADELTHAAMIALVTIGLSDTLAAVKWVDELAGGDR